MKLKKSAILFLAYAISMVSCTSPLLDQEISVEEQPNWKVGDCILAHFKMNITIPTDPKNPNVTTVINIPSSATVDTTRSKCNNITANEDQMLVLTWVEGPEKLHRELAMNFRRNLTSNFYGVERFYGNFMVKKWKVNGTDYNSTLNVDSSEVPKIMFHTPLERSFTCGAWGSTKLPAKNTIKPQPVTPITLPDATVQTSMLKFDAFRNDPNRKPPSATEFRNPLDCEVQPNDIVPIAVGIALAVLVVVVLIAYVIGRRRNRQRGYESV